MSSKRITDYEIQFVTRWRKAGYSARAIALAMGCGPQFVRSIGYGRFEGQFGRKELPVRWTKGLSSRVDVPPNLLGVYASFKRFMTSDPTMEVKTLKLAMTWVSDERLELWRDDWVEKHLLKGKCQLLNMEIYKSQLGDQQQVTG